MSPLMKQSDQGGITVSILLARALIIILMSVLINDMGQQLKGGVWSLFGFSGTEMMAILKCRGIVFNCLKTYSDKVG
uniref:Uncharacterized protein n=1 Tax=Anguilla anguilla TaxID=7936 RepID=A0A0E9Q219_ANGAN